MRKIAIASTSTAIAAAFASTPKSKAVEPDISPIGAGIEIPARKSRGGAASKYPFAQLEPGQYFGVKNKDARTMSSVVGNQNRKHRSELTAEDGTKSVTSSKEFRAVDVDADMAKKLKGSPQEGSTVLIFRTK